MTNRQFTVNGKTYLAINMDIMACSFKINYSLEGVGKNPSLNYTVIDEHSIKLPEGKWEIVARVQNLWLAKIDLPKWAKLMDEHILMPYDLILKKKSDQVFLWLDDIRDPEYYAPKFDGEIVWVKSFQEFKKFIDERGIPDMVSFDYTLDSKGNGLNCAMYLIEALLTRCGDEKFPKWAVHSEHPTKADELRKFISGEIKRKNLLSIIDL